MISFPNCKINLGLNILAKRSDGYHDLETIFVPVPFEDCLEIERTSNQSTLSISGLSIQGNLEDNLCWKALQLVKAKFDIPEVDIKLHKQIPTGAGLGGGSSDAAFTLKLLNTKFNLQLDQSSLMELAAMLGSDCPFFIVNRPCVGTERGNLLAPIEIPQVKGLYGMIVAPGVHISSAWAFQQVMPRKPSKGLDEIVQSEVSNWKNELVNDFEEPVFRTHPVLKDIKEQLYSAGAVYASLSGSGSAIYGLFKQLPTITFLPDYVVKTFLLAQNED